MTNHKDKAQPYLNTISWTLAIILLGWLHVRITTMESKFMPREMATLRLSNIEGGLRKIQRRIDDLPNDIPPRWLVERISHLERHIETIQEPTHQPHENSKHIPR